MAYFVNISAFVWIWCLKMKIWFYEIDHASMEHLFPGSDSVFYEIFLIPLGIFSLPFSFFFRFLCSRYVIRNGSFSYIMQG